MIVKSGLRKFYFDILPRGNTFFHLLNKKEDFCPKLQIQYQKKFQNKGFSVFTTIFKPKAIIKLTVGLQTSGASRNPYWCFFCWDLCFFVSLRCSWGSFFFVCVLLFVSFWQIFWQIFLKNFFDNFFLTNFEEYLTIVSFRIGVPSILFYIPIPFWPLK